MFVPVCVIVAFVLLLTKKVNVNLLEINIVMVTIDNKSDKNTKIFDTKLRKNLEKYAINPTNVSRTEDNRNNDVYRAKQN